MTGRALVIQGDAANLPLSDESVDLVITSPPYFALRSYRDGDEHYSGQIGSEPTPQDFLEALWTVTREMKRVLKPSGSIFVNLGDKYAGSGGHNNAGLAKPHTGMQLGGGRSTGTLGATLKTAPNHIPAERRNAPDRYNQSSNGIPAKSLMGLPWRYAIGCIDQLGLILRAEMVWDKPNGLPESVTDRVRRSHEQWFHFTKQGRYFAAVDEIREPHAPQSLERYGRWLPESQAKVNTDRQDGGRPTDPQANPLGKLPSSVWTIEEEGGVDWIGRVGLCRRCGKLRAAGSGQEVKLPQATRSSGVTEKPNLDTGSFTKSASAQSLQGYSSTISAGTEPVSTQPILSQSPSETTSSGGIPSQQETPPKPTAETDTSSTQQILTSLLTEAGCAECVCEKEIANATGAPRPLNSVWRIPSEPLIVPEWAKTNFDLPDHFAAFPQEWPRRLILGWSPSGICTVCGEGRMPVVTRELDVDDRGNVGAVGTLYTKATAPANGYGSNRGGRDTVYGSTEATITGYACACPTPEAPTRNSVVLDPFGGTGTVAMVAKVLGRTGLSVDLSGDYCRLADWRINHSGHGKKTEQRTWAEQQGVLA